MMIRARGFQFEMNLDKEILKISEFGKHLEDTKPIILKAMGVQATAWAVQDYRSRSDGQTASGIKWRPITDSAIRTRLAARQPWKNQRSQLQALKGDATAKAKKKRQSIRANRNKTIAKELSAARIGVDTGRLINSLVYGVQELSSIRVGKKATGNVTRAIFDVAGNDIHIGSAMKYAGYFDEKRPIFGPNFIGARRRKDLDALIEKTVEADAKTKFKGK